MHTKIGPVCFRVKTNILLKSIYFTFLTIHFGLFFAGYGADIPFYATILIGILYCLLRKKIRYNKVVIRLLCFMIVVFISLKWTINSNATNIAYTVIKYVIGAVMLYQMVESDRDVRYFFNSLMISSVFVLINTVVSVGGITGLQSVMISGFRIGDEIGGINGIGQVLSIGFCLSSFRIHYQTKYRLFFLTLTIAFFLTAIATGSKRALFIMLLFTFAIVFFRNRKNFLKLILITAALTGAFMVIMNLPFMSFLSGRVDEFMSVLKGSNTNVDATDAVRMQLILYSITLFFDSPIVGHGVDSAKLLNLKEFGIAYSTHNLYADIIANFGLLGICTFLSIGVSNFTALIKRAKKCAGSLPDSLVLLISLNISVILMTNIASVSYQNSMLIYSLYIVISRVIEIMSQEGEIQL